MSVFVSPYSPTQQSGVVARFPPNIYAITNRAPTTSDYAANVGDFWVYLNNSIWQLVGKPQNVANWIEQSAVGSLAQLTGDSGTATPTSNSIALNGTTDEITTTASGSAIVFSIPSAFVAPGSITATTTVSGTTLYASGDAGGASSTNSLSNASSTTISTGVGSVKMSSANAGTNTAWIKVYVGTVAHYIPAWTTNSP